MRFYMLQISAIRLMAHFAAWAKPGYPLQFLDFAHAKSAGFPLLSLALLTG